MKTIPPKPHLSFSPLPIHHLIILSIIIISAQLACDQKTDAPPPLPLSPQGLPIAQLTLNHTPITVELALTRAARTRGLMHRPQLPPNTGMLFIFQKPQIRTFYMKNCLIDLDILFIRADCIIAKITTMKVPLPNQPLTYHSSTHPVPYVLELPAGTRKTLNLKPGQKISFPPEILSQPPEPD